MDWMILQAPFILILLSVVLTCGLGDLAVSLAAFPSWQRAVLDSTVHGVVALLSWVAVSWPVVSWRLVVLAGVLGAAIDLDHVIMAGAFDIHKLVNLPSRPPLHCTTPFLLLLPLLVVSSRPEWRTAAAVILTAALSHHLRDANRRGLWLWPAGSTPPLPTPLYLVAEVALVLLLRWLLVPTVRAAPGDLVVKVLPV